MHNVLRSLLIALLAISLPLVANAQVKATDIALIEDVDGSITAAAATPNSYLAKASCAARAAGYTDTYDAIFVWECIDHAYPCRRKGKFRKNIIEKIFGFYFLCRICLEKREGGLWS